MGLAIAGIPTGTDTPDLAVATPATLGAALACAADHVVVEGRSVARQLRTAGYTCRVIMPMPSFELPELLLPLGDGYAARRLLQTWRRNPGLPGKVRYAAAWSLAASGSAARLRPVLTVGSRAAGPPFPVGAAKPLGVPADVSWFLASPGIDALSRVVFLLAPRRTTQAQWALKVSRSRDEGTAFVNEERAFALLNAAGAEVAARAPRLLGRFNADKHECSLETAAPGERLSTLLPREGAAGYALIDAIAGWIVGMGRATVTAGGSGVELARVAADVLPRWGVPDGLVTAVDGIPSVLAHHDLGPWNIVAAGTSFMAVDWEDARPSALPLWDLAYFLVHALPLAQGTNQTDPAGAMLALLRGQTPQSATLFRWLRAGADSLGISYAAVPAIVTMCWLHHGLSHFARAALAEPAGGHHGGFVPPIERIVSAWLSDSDLGADWPAWQASLR